MNSMTISRKVLVVCGVLLVAMMLQAGVALVGFSRVGTGLSGASDFGDKGVAHSEENIREAAKIEVVKSDANSSLWSVLLLCLGCGLGGVVLVVLTTRGIDTGLRQTLTELGETAERMARSSSDVDSASSAAAAGSQEQTEKLRATLATSSEMSSIAVRNSENFRSTAQIVTDSQARVHETNVALEQMVEAVDGIAHQSQKISKIIKVIDEIAFQTNILALNAAVEAARAGDAGKGFAVVAEEVRNLAQRCARAAQDTTSLIEDSIEKSHDGKARVDQVAESIRVITLESARMKTLVDEINLGSVEQARGIDQIARSVAQIEEVAKKSLVSAGQSVDGAQELGSQSETLQRIVERLHGMFDGAAGEEWAKRTLPERKTLTSPVSRNSKAAEPKTVVANFKSTVTFPKPQVLVAVSAGSATGGSNPFPMDDDFAEF
jgi:methyl-accepting chemotaxis protein